MLAEQQDIELDSDPVSGITPTEISDVSSPQLPTDCLAPHMLWERATANTGRRFRPHGKIHQRRRHAESPAEHVLAPVGMARGQNESDRRDAGHHRPRPLRKSSCRCSRSAPIPCRFVSATDPLAFATAALAARSRGARALAQDLLGAAQMATENLIERYVRPEQTKGRRRMPYGARRRIVYL